MQKVDIWRLDLIRQAAGPLSRTDLETLLEIINLALKVNSGDELKQLWPKVADFVELEGVIFGVSKSQTSKAGVQFDLVTFGIDDEWINAYRQSQSVDQDPIVLAALQSDLPISWNAAAKIALKVDRKAFRNGIFRKQATAAGLQYGHIYCRRSDYVAQVLSVTAVTTGKQPMTEYQSFLLDILLPHLNEILIRQGFTSSPLLSEREAEVLRWTTAGKSNWEMATILNISERTVKFHLRNIYRKLEVNNRSQAVAEAMRTGVVDLQ